MQDERGEPKGFLISNEINKAANEIARTAVQAQQTLQAVERAATEIADFIVAFKKALAETNR